MIKLITIAILYFLGYFKDWNVVVCCHFEYRDRDKRNPIEINKSKIIYSELSACKETERRVRLAIADASSPVKSEKFVYICMPFHVQANKKSFALRYDI